MVRADGARFPFPFLRAALLRVSAPPRETGFHEKSHDPSQQILRRPSPLPPNPPAPAVLAAQDDAPRFVPSHRVARAKLRTQDSALKTRIMTALALMLIAIAAFVHVIPHAAIKGAADRYSFV